MARCHGAQLLAESTFVSSRLCTEVIMHVHRHRGHPDMNSLIGLGAATSFLAGAAALLVPEVGLQSSFLEEPVMLLAIVLLGRTLEARARLKASGAF